MKQIFITVKTQFEGFHRWWTAPPEVSFLKDWHRHLFIVRMSIKVTTLNRELEFFTVKKQLDAYLREFTGGDHRFEFSCEQLADMILEKFNASIVTVEEDGENGGTVMNSPDYIELLEPKEEKEIPLNKWEEKRTKCFVGIEAEGPHRGQNVLFVPGSCTPERYMSIWRRCWGGGRYQRMYYGAGNDRELDYIVLENLLNTVSANCIDIEVNMFAVLHGMRITGDVTIITHREEDMSDTRYSHYRNLFYKYVKNGVITWQSRNGIIHLTRVDDPLFDKDTYIE